MTIVVLWAFCGRVLEVHQDDDGARVAVLVDGGKLTGLWHLPRRSGWTNQT